MSSESILKLKGAKKAKNDEFYTQLSDVSKELMHYKQYFKDKIVFCNCDDPTWSAFWKYFHLNFHELDLKKLISTHYDKNEPTYKMEYDGTLNNNSTVQYSTVQDIDNDIEVGVKTPLQGNGDFRNQECIDLLKECDVVVTNPPFSLFREYVAQLIEYDKKFIIIGRYDASAYTDFFPLIINNKVWCGYNFHLSLDFIVPNNIKLDKAYIDPIDNLKKVKVPMISWWTNLDHSRRYEYLVLWQHYYDENGKPVVDAEKRWPHYDNYDAINIDRMKDIPCDYYGIMGVPVTGLGLINPKQFEIIGSEKYPFNIPLKRDLAEYANYVEMRPDGTKTGATGMKTAGNPNLAKNNLKGNYYLNPQTGHIIQSTYSRIFIRRKREEE